MFYYLGRDLADVLHAKFSLDDLRRAFRPLRLARLHDDLLLPPLHRRILHVPR